jgi:hypothetical protein
VRACCVRFMLLLSALGRSSILAEVEASTISTQQLHRQTKGSSLYSAQKRRRSWHRHPPLRRDDTH